MTGQIAPLGLLVDPLPDLAAWSAFFSEADIPVTRDAAETLELLRSGEDAVDANRIGEMLSRDPLMTLKILVHDARQRNHRVSKPAETITAAIVMMGVSPFFRAFGPQPVVDDRMRQSTPLLNGLDHALLLARASADLAFAFARHRADSRSAAVYAAALLHDFAHLLLWCHAPHLADRVAAIQAAEPHLPREAIERDVLSIELHPLQNHLVRAWGLSPLLLEASPPVVPRSSMAAHTVSLAARIARHRATRTEGDRVSRDLEEASAWLSLPPDSTMLLLQQVLGRELPTGREGG